MTKRNRIFIGILLVYALGVGVLMLRLVEDIDPRYRESAEESLVETAHLLATLIEQSEQDGTLDVSGLSPLFKSVYGKRFEATIYGFVKSRVELRVYVTHRTAVMYVAAPIRLRDEIVGVVTVGKPVLSFGQFIEAARRKTIVVGLTSVAAVLLLAVILSVWLVRPFGLISDYARYVRSQRSFHPLRLGRRAIGMLGAAYDEMRDALAGRNYVADYVQTLTHEVKSPLSAIRGAAELLQEPMPEPDRQRFLGNITRETQRIQELVDRMLELASLETRRRLDQVRPVDLKTLLEEIAASAQATAALRQISVTLQAPHGVTVEGDAFLLRRAITNLVDNAIDFSSPGQSVRIDLHQRGKHAEVIVTDQGPGVPAYAEGRVFDKFYSLARPHSKKKSTGLGLAFVKEVAGLHDGRVSLHNGVEGGAVATLVLPVPG